MTSDPLLHIHLAELFAEYFARVDRLLETSAAEVFAHDGRMLLGTMALSGHEAITSYFVQRRAAEDEGGRKTRHFMSNLVVESATAGSATARLQCLVYAGVGDFPLPSAPPATIADFSVDCILSDKAWLIQELRGTTTFSGADAAPFTR